MRHSHTRATSTKWEQKSAETMAKPLHITDIEQPLPRRNLIYLAYILPEELENFSPEVCAPLHERFDVSVHRTGHTIDAL